MQIHVFRFPVLLRTTNKTGNLISGSMCAPFRSSRSVSTAIFARRAPSYLTVVRAGCTISHIGVSSKPAMETSPGTENPCAVKKCIRSMA